MENLLTNKYASLTSLIRAMEEGEEKIFYASDGHRYSTISQICFRLNQDLGGKCYSVHTIRREYGKTVVRRNIINKE